MKYILHICHKELREMFRDKRVRGNALYMPMIVMLLILSMLGFLIDTVSKPSNVKLHIVKTSNLLADSLIKNLSEGKAPDLTEEQKAALKKAGGKEPPKEAMKVISIDSIEEGKALIEKGDANLVLEFEAGKADAPQLKINAYFDPKEEKARVALGAIHAAFGYANQIQLRNLVVSKGLPPEAAEPIKVIEKEVQVGKKGGAGAFLISFLPYIVVLYAFVGAMGSAGDIIAGEKERQTLETLLISPVKRLDILLGKLFALSTVSLSSSLSATLGVVVATSSGLPMFKRVAENGLGMGVPEFLVVLAVLLPLVAMLTSVMLAVSSYAKNIREAQTHLAMLSLFITLPAMMSQFIGYTDFGKTLGINAIPVLNTANVIRAAMQGKVEALPVLITFGVNALLAIIALTLATRMFKKERILVRV